MRERDKTWPLSSAQASHTGQAFQRFYRPLSGSVQEVTDFGPKIGRQIQANPNVADNFFRRKFCRPHQHIQRQSGVMRLSFFSQLSF